MNMKRNRHTAEDSPGEMIGLAGETIENFKAKAWNHFKLEDDVSLIIYEV